MDSIGRTSRTQSGEKTHQKRQRSGAKIGLDYQFDPLALTQAVLGLHQLIIYKLKAEPKRLGVPIDMEVAC